MPISRMRMRPWLEKMIDSNSISGLTWVDKEKTMFSIPWKHAARHGWELHKDACLFKEWAIHTGKYAEGQSCDPKTWKANFRCAMNSLPDIEEVKDRSVNKGQQAMRIFRMLPVHQKSREKRSKAKERRKKSSVVKREKEDTDYSDTQSPIDASLPEETMSTQENTIDSTVHSEQQDFTYWLPSSEIPEWSCSVEIGTDFTPANFCERFQVSPAHSSDQEKDIIEICEQLEKETELHWITSSFDMGFQGNEACTSPLSQWSDTCSDNTDELPQYTTLSSEFTNFDEIWSRQVDLLL